MTDKLTYATPVLLVTLFSIVLPRSVYSQQAPVPMFDTTLTAAAYSESARDQTLIRSFGMDSISQDSAKEKRQHYAERGAIIGGVALGTLGALTALSLCDYGDNPPDNCFYGVAVSFFFASVPGTIFGGLIGFAFTKPPPAAE
jgi:hypothetical protein